MSVHDARPIWRDLSLRLLLAADAKRIFGLGHVYVALPDPGHRHGDPVEVLAALLDVVGRIGERAVVEQGGVQETGHPVESDGRTEQRRKIERTHRDTLLPSDIWLRGTPRRAVTPVLVDGPGKRQPSLPDLGSTRSEAHTSQLQSPT